MSKSYTPGLKILENTNVVKDRILPLKGKIHVSKNDSVSADTIVASTEIPGNVHMINVANELNIDAKHVQNCMLVSIEEEVKSGQVIAQSKGIFGLFKTEVKSPIDGKLINISDITGQVVLSEKPLSINVDAYIPGNVTSIIEKEGVTVESTGTFIQGIIGIGGEQKGCLEVLVDSPKKKVDESFINDSLKDKIIVCGSYIDYKTYRKAYNVGAKGIVCGGFDYNEIEKILGKPLGVAITGTEDTMNLILTEGFGEIYMAQRTFDILKKNNGKMVSINGATQIRAGVQRPEIFIYSNSENKSNIFTENDLIISEGSIVRVIRAPYFGMIGKVTSLPPELIKLKSETKVRVAEIEIDNKKEIIPRANLEVILSNTSKPVVSTS